MKRREYSVVVVINGILINKVIIDSHYEVKHGGSIDDQLIMNLVRLLNGEEFDPVGKGHGFKYFVRAKLEYQGKLYKLIFLLEEGMSYIGIVNCFRR